MKLLSLFWLLTMAAAKYDNNKGVYVKNDNAIVSMGAKGDVNLVRTGEKKLLVTADVDVSGNLKVGGKDVLAEIAAAKKGSPVQKSAKTFKADVNVDGKLKVGGKDVMSEIAAAKKGPVVHYGDKQFFHCKGKSRRCLETSSLQHGSSREIIISGNQNLGNFELEFFVRGNSFVEVMATVMHCGGGCHSDFMDKKFAFNGYMQIRDMTNTGYKDYGGTTGETTFKAKGGDGNTGGHWEVTRRITSWNQHGSYSGLMRLRHVKGRYGYGGPYYIRVRSSNHDLGLVRHIDEPASTCVFDCAKKKCTGKQPKGKACSCYVSGACPELKWNNAAQKLSVCC